MVKEGKLTFRYDTFGSEAFWGDTLKLHQAIAGEKNGGVGPGVSPKTASAAGLKVDMDTLPKELEEAIKAGKVNLDDPATTLELLKINAVLGVNKERLLTVLKSWGPGKFDASIFMDGKAFGPDGKSAATLIPPAYGLAGVNLHTYEGWGSVTYWNAFVANLEMHGQGTFFDPRLNNAEQFPVAAKAGFYNVRSKPDLVTSKLAALHSPKPKEGSFDKVAAGRGI